MSASYSTAAVCDFENRDKCDLVLDPLLENILSKEKDYDKLAHYWTAWHDTMSNAVTAQQYSGYIQLSNEISQANGFHDTGEQSADAYNDFTPNWTFDLFRQSMADSFAAIKPTYMKLHAYVRMKMRNYYGPKVTHPLGFMPINILGNMWGQEWTAIHGVTKPFPNAPSLDATSAFLAKGYTVERIYQEADKFFQELGLFPMSPHFWQKSMVAKPSDGRQVICHATAFEFCQRVPRGENADYRIRMCTQVNQADFATVHHEMGHIQYYMAYAHQPFPFRNGANPGFHEAIGDSLDLTVETPKHLQCALQLSTGTELDCDAIMRGEPVDAKPTEADLNLLYFKALEKFPMFGFSYSMESWKWEAASGAMTPEQYNDRWWDIRRENQGLIPPADRPSTGFDPAAKYHIVADVEYIRYYWSNILQFQFFQAMCIYAGEFNLDDPNSKPLYECDFSGNRKAGKKLLKMLSRGSSLPWPDILEEFTGSRILDPGPILNYFRPLLDYLDGQLQENGENACFGLNC
ncbi:angiotensin-converting enzyme [Folsomia candida]|uniref:angiotensin-converting enzyme n=1 Tax=Folsomia candida TaxID=158441 RepID=UPI0016055198|nr:angiotensin-converting enzyme [Folsomia candida]